MAIKKPDLEEIKGLLVDFGKFPISLKGDDGFLKNNMPIPPIEVLRKLEVCRSHIYNLYYEVMGK